MQREFDTKEWLEVHTFNHRWTASSNHKHLPDNIADLDIIAFAVVQDCNMGGSYHRVFTYTSAKERFFEVTDIKAKTPLPRRIFDIPFLDWQVGTKVTDVRTQRVYECVQVEKTYFKCLELVR